MKKLFALALVVALLSWAAPVMAESRLLYCDPLSLALYLDSGLEPYLQDQTLLAILDLREEGDGEVLFFHIADPERVGNDIDALRAEEELLCAVSRQRPETPYAIEGLESASVAQVGGANYLLMLPGAAETDGYTAQGQSMLALLRQSFADPEAAFLLGDEYPIDKDSVLGNFTTTDIYGETYTAKELFAEGKLNVLLVWGTYCSVCIEEMPTFAALAKEYADQGVRFVGLVSDIVGDPDLAESARGIVEDSGAQTFPHLLPSEAMYMNALSDVYALPTHYLLDSEGHVIGSPIVGSLSEEGWRAMLDGQLAKLGADV